VNAPGSDATRGRARPKRRAPPRLLGPPPFTEKVRDLLKTIRDTFADVRPLSLEGWEGGFRCDAHPEKEIALWLNMAAAYRHFTRHLTPGPTELEKKRDIFQLILPAANNGPDHAA